jgi:hypothetical protein
VTGALGHRVETLAKAPRGATSHSRFATSRRRRTAKPTSPRPLAAQTSPCSGLDLPSRVDHGIRRGVERTARPARPTPAYWESPTCD